MKILNWLYTNKYIKYENNLFYILNKNGKELK